MKEIKDIVGMLTSDELEFHRDLIEECQRREIQIKKRVVNIEKITSVMDEKTVAFIETLTDFHNRYNAISTRYREMQVDLFKVLLITMPEDKFFKA